MRSFLRAKIQSLLLLLAVFGLFGCGGYEEPKSRWAGLLGPELQAMGYRNWVVVADAAAISAILAMTGVRRQAGTPPSGTTNQMCLWWKPLAPMRWCAWTSTRPMI